MSKENVEEINVEEINVEKKMSKQLCTEKKVPYET